jgi:hypothetical protein
MNDEPTIRLEELYLDYVNNFLTVERFAEYYGLSVELANLIIKEGKAKQELIATL